MLALLLSMSPSWASHQYYVWTGGSYAAEGVSDFVFYDENGSQTIAWGCNEGEFEGAFPPGIYTRPGVVGPVNSSDWIDCTGPGGLNFAYAQHGTWDFVATGPATKSLTDVVEGYVDNISMAVADTDFGGYVCQFTVSGTIDATLHEAETAGGQRIELHETQGNLVIDTVSAPCLGTIGVGYTMDLIGTLEVDSYAPINIDSPGHS